MRYALDELNRPLPDIGSRLTDAANLDEQPFEEFLNRWYLIGEFSDAYSRAMLRAHTRTAHEAIEKGLKAILLDVGISSHGHKLHKLLEDVKQHNPTEFNELERCFDSTIKYLESVTSAQYNTNVVDYFREHGRSKVFESARYESIEGKRNDDEGMIGRVYREILLALLSLILGWTPKDIFTRIEEEIEKAILEERKRDPEWDAVTWLSRGPTRPRLEDAEAVHDNKVLRAAVRRIARKSKDGGIQMWARRVRSNINVERKKALEMNRKVFTGRTG